MKNEIIVEAWYELKPWPETREKKTGKIKTITRTKTKTTWETEPGTKSKRRII